MVCLVILDAIFVLVELLIDLSVIKLEHGHIAPQVRHRFAHHGYNPDLLGNDDLHPFFLFYRSFTT